MEQKTKADRNFGGHFISGFFKWAAVALVVGAVGGVVGSAQKNSGQICDYL